MKKEDLEGKTFEEFFKIVMEENNKIVKKIRDKFGSTIFTPEVEKFLTEDELETMRLGQAVRNPENISVKFK